MRYAVRHRLRPRGATPRRLAAAQRALRRECDRHALFAEQVRSEQGTAQQRIERFDQELLDADQRHRELAATQWRWGRRQIARLSAEVRAQILSQWNCSSIPPTAAYFADFVRRRMRQRGLPLDDDA